MKWIFTHACPAVIMLIIAGLTVFYCSYQQTSAANYQIPSIFRVLDLTPGWKVYSDPLFGISFSYPNDWTVVEDSTDHLTIKGTSSTGFLTITVNEPISNETLDKLTRRYGEELKNTFASGPSILQDLNPVSILSVNRTTIGLNNSTANEMAYEIGQPSDSGRTKGVAFLTKGNEGRLYILTYENTAADFENILPNFIKIIQSFETVGLLS